MGVALTDFAHLRIYAYAHPHRGEAVPESTRIFRDRLITTFSRYWTRFNEQFDIAIRSREPRRPFCVVEEPSDHLDRHLFLCQFYDVLGLLERTSAKIAGRTWATSIPEWPPTDQLDVTVRRRRLLRAARLYYAEAIGLDDVGFESNEPSISRSVQAAFSKYSGTGTANALNVGKPSLMNWRPHSGLHVEAFVYALDVNFYGRYSREWILVVKSIRQANPSSAAPSRLIAGPIFQMQMFIAKALYFLDMVNSLRRDGEGIELRSPPDFALDDEATGRGFVSESERALENARIAMENVRKLLDELGVRKGSWLANWHLERVRELTDSQRGLEKVTVRIERKIVATTVKFNESTRVFSFGGKKSAPIGNGRGVTVKQVIAVAKLLCDNQFKGVASKDVHLASGGKELTKLFASRVSKAISPIRKKIEKIGLTVVNEKGFVRIAKVN